MANKIYPQYRGARRWAIGDRVTDETGYYTGRVCIVWDDGDICSIENDAAHPNPVLIEPGQDD